jgi:SAM-dependent methyltransferase
MTADGPALETYLSGAISAPVALLRLLLPGTSAAVTAALERRAAAAPDAAADEWLRRLLDLAQQHRDGLGLLERMVQAGAAHGCEANPAMAIAANRAMFDRLVAISPEASVAAYTLGDAGLLRAATDELVGWLERQGLLSGRAVVLDLGGGIGRLAAALAPHAAEVMGLAVSPGMIAAARQRCEGYGNLRFAVSSGHDMAGVADASCDLVLAVDVFPYPVAGGMALAAGHVAEAGRVLRSGGNLVILTSATAGMR